MGGLAAAIDLSRAGHAVTVLERRSAPGGKMREVQVGDAAVDSGPTVLTMRWAFENLFRDAGAALGERVTLRKADILARHAWSETERLDLFSDDEKSAHAIREFAGSDAAQGYLAFRKRAREIYETLEHTFIRASQPSQLGLVRRSGGLVSLLKINPFESMWKELSRHFADPRLRQLFGRYATYCGSNPFEAPATLMLVAHVELDGVWIIEGGMQRLAEAMAKLAAELGAEIRYDSAVEELEREGGKVRALRLENGERIECDAAVVNAAPSALARGFLGDSVRGATRPLARSMRSLSAITWTLHAKTRGFPLERHNVFFSRDYEREFREILQEHRFPSEPTVYVCCQDRGHGSVPDGAERLFMIINAPPVGDQHSFSEAEIEACKTQTFSVLERCGLTIEPGPTVVTTPNDFEAMFPGTGGSIYGMATHGSRASFKRPSSRSKIPGLYFAGGATHPGAGVPNSTVSGRLAAAAVLEDFDSTSWWAPADIRGGTSTL